MGETKEDTRKQRHKTTRTNRHKGTKQTRSKTTRKKRELRRQKQTKRSRGMVRGKPIANVSHKYAAQNTCAGEQPFPPRTHLNSKRFN